eukprot:jgi/Picsp_1/5596/NSC_02955-R1_---NA---
MGGRRNKKNQESGQGEGGKKNRVPNLDLGKNAIKGEFSSSPAIYSARKSYSRREDSKSGTNTGRRRTSFERQGSQTRNNVAPVQGSDSPSLGKKGTLYSVQENKGLSSPYIAISCSGIGSQWPTPTPRGSYKDILMTPRGQMPQTARAGFLGREVQTAVKNPLSARPNRGQSGIQSKSKREAIQQNQTSKNILEESSGRVESSIGTRQATRQREHFVDAGYLADIGKKIEMLEHDGANDDVLRLYLSRMIQQAARFINLPVVVIEMLKVHEKERLLPKTEHVQMIENLEFRVRDKQATCTEPYVHVIKTSIKPLDSQSERIDSIKRKFEQLDHLLAMSTDQRCHT